MSYRRMALSLFILPGCTDGGDDAVQQMVREEDGVEIAIVRQTPSLRDAWFAAPERAARAIETVAASGDIRVFEPSAGALRASQIVVADRTGPPLIIFDRSNEVRTRIGQRGQGPGEIADPQPLVWWDGSDRVGVGDRANGKLLVFRVSGSLASETKIDYSGFGLLLNWAVDRRSGEVFAQVTAASRAGTDWIVRIDRDTGDHVKLVELGTREHQDPTSAPRLWKTRPLWAVLPGGLIVTGQNDVPVVSVWTQSGTLIREIAMPWTVRVATREDVIRVIEAIGDRFEPGERFPLTDQFVPVSDTTFAIRHTWVANPEGSNALDGESVAWSVFTVTGEPLGTVRFPPFYLPLMVHDARVLGVGRDRLGVAQMLIHELPF